MKSENFIFIVSAFIRGAGRSFKSRSRRSTISASSFSEQRSIFLKSFENVRSVLSDFRFLSTLSSRSSMPRQSLKRGFPNLPNLAVRSRSLKPCKSPQVKTFNFFNHGDFDYVFYVLFDVLLDVLS